MAVYAVSDLHIRGPHDPLYRSLLALLRDRAQRGDTVVLAGDVFDLFVGNKRVFTERYGEFLRELAAAGERGVAIHYIEGNHDFLLRRAFARIPGLALHPQDFEVTVATKRFFFSHGDLVDRQDYGYRFMRFMFRTWLMKLLVALFPGRLLEWIGARSSYASQARSPRLPTQLPQGRMERLRNLYRSHAAERIARGCDFVVMGHCHDLDEKFFHIDGRPGQYVNVGFPRAHGSFLSWSPGDERIQRERLPES